MRVTMMLLAITMMLSSCRPVPPAIEGPGDIPMVAPHRETTATESPILPEDDPLISREDTNGIEPDGAVLAYVEAIERSEWQAAYSMVATPVLDFPTLEREWSTTHEHFERFIVHEVRMPEEDVAYVRVTYESWVREDDRNVQVGGVDEPGEWWSVHKVDGAWKVARLPWQ